MKKEFLKPLQKKCFKHCKGRDYLRLVIKEDNLKGLEELIDIMDRLDTDNSNFQVKAFEDRKMSIFKVSTKAGEAIIGTTVYNDISVPIMFLERYDEHTATFSKSWGRVDYYGMFDRLLTIGEIQKSESVEKMFGYLHSINKGKKISRYDWKIDFFHKVNKNIFRPEDITKLRVNSKVDYKVVGGKIQSWRLGARKSKQYLIRGYDKQADTLVKGKFPMYKDYFTDIDKETGEKHDFKEVYRLEFEFLNNFCKNFTYDTIGELEEHIEKFLDYDKSIGSIFDTRNDTEMGEVKDRFKYADSTKGYMKGCIANGINIFGLLEEVFNSMGKSEEEIQNIFIDFLERRKYMENMVSKQEDLFYHYFKNNKQEKIGKGK